MLNFRKHPVHLLTGFGIIGIGTRLLLDDAYFSWPPGFRDLANDDIVGFIFIVIGISIAVWAFSPDNNAKWNRWNLVIAAVLMTFLAVYQFLHVIGTGHDNLPWISNAMVAGYIVLIAARSDAG